VFLSHKREDRARIDVLAAALGDLDLKVWYDAGLAPGKVRMREIEENARTAKAIVVCWTPEAAQSEYVLREAEIARKRDVLAPVLLARCEIPADYARVRAADLTSWSGELGAPEWLSLLRRLEPLTGREGLERRSAIRAGGQDEALVADLRAALIERAGGEPITYEEARSLLQRETDGSYPWEALWAALDSIAAQNRARREPPLFALVVDRDTRLPGRGYFQKHAFLSGDDDPLAHQVHWRHLERVRAFDWRKAY
jgi:hypothetical protein